MSCNDASVDSTNALGNAIAALLAAPAQLAAALAGGAVQQTSPGCEIPAPCWEPRPAGTCELVLPPGGTGTLRIHVNNCEWSRRVLLITAVGKIAGWLKFTPTTLVIDPQGDETFLVTVRVPEEVKPGQRLTGPVVVRGCNDHFVKVIVRVEECAGRTCRDVHVKDCADNIHHWYDHFYCPRPCRTITERKPTDG
jgi:hypothetical protein